jgi:archaemetzincin
MKPEIFGVLLFSVIIGCPAKGPQHKDQKREVSPKQEKICVVAISKLDSSLLKKLSIDLGKIFGQAVEVTESPLNLEFAYNPERKQYYSSAILGKLPKLGSEDCARILGLVDVDLYVPDLNFVFGEADVVEKTAIISTKRLRPGYWGLPEDESLFWERTLKEAVHELGHTYGLGHCPEKRCVMHFSNTLRDTDIKSSSFCENCRRKLMSVIRLED